jgi:sugar phosphate isomerase/epimerase
MNVFLTKESGMTDEITEEQLQVLKVVHINIPWKFLPHHLDLILDCRMNVEIGFEGKELDRLSRTELEEVAVRLQKRGCTISLHGPFWDLCPGSLDPLIRQISYSRLSQFFDLANIFGPIHVVCHTGFDDRHHRGHRRFWLEKSLTLWEPLVKRAETLKFPLLLENVWEQTPDFHLELFQSVNSPWFGFCFDVGHQHSFSTTNLSVWLDHLAGFLREVHLHDNDGTHDDHLPVGEGNIDFLLLFEFLQRRNIHPTLTLEPHEEKHLYASLAGLHRFFSQMTTPPDANQRWRIERTALWP